MKTLTLRDGALSYQLKGSGPSLLLLHAGVADSRMWDDQVDRLAKRLRVVRCDLRGFGRSVLPNGPFAHHEDVRALVEALDLAPACLVGASFGARVAIDLALACPALVKGLILVSPVVSGFTPTGEVARFNAREDALLEAGRLADATELNLRIWVDGPHRASGDVDPVVRQRVGEMQLRAFSQPEPEGVSLIGMTPPAIDRLHEIRQPALIVSGELDVSEFLQLAGLMAEAIPRATRIVVPGAAHLVSMERPGQFHDLALGAALGMQ